MKISIPIIMEILGVIYIGFGFIGSVFGVSEKGEFMMMTGLMLTTLGTIIYYGEKKYTTEVHK